MGAPAVLGGVELFGGSRVESEVAVRGVRVGVQGGGEGGVHRIKAMRRLAVRGGGGGGSKVGLREGG